MITEPAFFPEAVDANGTEPTPDTTTPDVTQADSTISDAPIDKVPETVDIPTKETDIAGDISTDDLEAIVANLLAQQNEELKTIDTEEKSPDDVELDTISVEEYNKDMEIIEEFVAQREESVAAINSQVEELTAKIWEYDKVLNHVLEEHELGGVFKAVIIWEEDSIPAHMKSENWSRLENNKYLYPLVQRVLQGEDVSIPNYLKEILESRKDMLNTSKSIAATPPPPPPVKENVMKNVLQIKNML